MYRTIAVRLVPLLFVCYTVAYLDRVDVGFARLPMDDELWFSDAVHGIGAGVFFVGYILFEVPSNVVLHRVGPRRWIARIMVSWGPASGLMALANSPTTFYLLRFLLGVAEAGFIRGFLLSGVGAAAGIALVNSIGNVAGAVSTSLVGVVSEATGSTAGSLYLFGGVLVVGGGLVLALRTSR